MTGVSEMALCKLKREMEALSVVNLWRRWIMSGTNSFHKKMGWTPLLLCILVVLSSIELASCSQHRSEHRSSLMSGLQYDPERPPPKTEQETTILPVSSLSLHPMTSKPPYRAWQGSHREYISIPNHPSIKKYISYYKAGRGQGSLNKALERAWPYIPILSEILKSHGVPPELLSVALVESHFNNRPARRGMPAGLWQLAPSTARKMGLCVNQKADERLDPIKSTDAAARHLRDLYDQFNSWPLALAAYNAGEGRIQRAIGNRWPEDLWEVYALKPLPSRTREYISKVMAVIVLTRNQLL